MMQYTNENRPPHNPNAMPLGKRPYPPSPLPFGSSMPRNGYTPQPRGRSRSPHRPVKVFEIHKDGGLVSREEAKNEDWTNNSEVLHDLLEKLTLRLDTANVEVTSQKAETALLEKILKEKETLIEQYQKNVRNSRTEIKDLHGKIEEAVKQCEKFKWEVVKLSHELHYMRTTTADNKDMYQLRMRCIKLRRERDIARDQLADFLKQRGGCLEGWPNPEERAIKNEFDV